MQWHTPIDMFMFHSKIKQCRVIVLAFKFQPLVTPTLDVRQNSKLISLGLHHLTWLSLRLGLLPQSSNDNKVSPNMLV